MFVNICTVRNWCVQQWSTLANCESTCTLSTCEILYVRGPTFDFLFNCLHDHFQPGSFYLFICLVYVIFPMHLVQSFLLRPLVRYSLHRTSTVYCTSSLFVLQRWNYGARVGGASLFVVMSFVLGVMELGLVPWLCASIVCATSNKYLPNTSMT